MLRIALLGGAALPSCLYFSRIWVLTGLTGGGVCHGVSPVHPPFRCRSHPSGSRWGADTLRPLARFDLPRRSVGVGLGGGGEGAHIIESIRRTGWGCERPTPGSLSLSVTSRAARSQPLRVRRHPRDGRPDGTLSRYPREGVSELSRLAHLFPTARDTIQCFRAWQNQQSHLHTNWQGDWFLCCVHATQTVM
uniref:Secreted protein n=1 Tax=Knipowitschia caucasica TaxID=637954 RepID=A0AAV2M2P1_KNICA